MIQHFTSAVKSFAASLVDAWDRRHSLRKFGLLRCVKVASHAPAYMVTIYRYWQASLVLCHSPPLTLRFTVMSSGYGYGPTKRKWIVFVPA